MRRSRSNISVGANTGGSALAFDFARPAAVAGWASLAALMIVPLTIVLLVFPGFVAL